MSARTANSLLTSVKYSTRGQHIQFDGILITLKSKNNIRYCSQTNPIFSKQKSWMHTVILLLRQHQLPARIAQHYIGFIPDKIVWNGLMFVQITDFVHVISCLKGNTLNWLIDWSKVQVVPSRTMTSHSSHSEWKDWTKWTDMLV